MLDLLSINSAIHSVEVKNAAGQALAIDGSGYLTINAAGGSLAVTATDLDIRALASGTDSVSAVQSGTWDIGTLGTITNVVSIDDNGGSITVDGAVSTTAGGFSSWKTTVETVGATAAEVVATPLTSRVKCIFQNLSNANDICLGEDNTVTMTGSTAGLLLPKKGHFTELFDATADIYAIADGAGTELRVIEFAA